MEYNAKSIERLTFREGCRKRIGIYLGSADRTGVLAGLLELVNNDKELLKDSYIKTWYRASKNAFLQHGLIK